MRLGFLLGYPAPLDYVASSLLAPHGFDSGSSVVHSEICMSDTPRLSLKTALATWGLLCLHVNFKIICSNFLKNAIDVLIGTALYL